ncbi:MAG: galactosyltransferase-related protein [Phycisphaerales bacterium JB040]
MRRAHLILVTHTPDRIRRTLLGASVQTVPPATVTLTCDGDDDSIRDAAARACEEFGLGLTLIRRPHAGVSRSAQVRNNGVRSLIEAGASDGDALVFLDGDCVPEGALIAKHLDALTRGGLVLGWRYDLHKDQDEAFDEEALRRCEHPIVPTPAQEHALAKRRRRFVKQARLRALGLGRLGLVKPHKPKLITANFATTLAHYRAVNGIDETYEGWGQEDDDFARRLYQHGVRPVVAVGTIHTYHQHHPTRAPGEWHNSPNADRLNEKPATRCARGLVDPVDQAEVSVERLGG